MEAILGDLTPTYGLYDVEFDVNGNFVWAKGRFGLRGNAGGDFYAARMCYYGDAGTLQIRAASGWKTDVLLQRGWNTYVLDIGAAVGQEIHFRVDPLMPVQTDRRELGVMIRRFRCLRDRQVYGRLSAALDNKQLNDEEFTQGKTVLTSCPSLLRLATHSECDVVPRCVYCDWELAKRDESESDLVFSTATLERMGRFFQRAAAIGELSYGEPLLNRDFSSFVGVLDGWGKPISMASNGQAMGPRVRHALLGMDIELYVSVDAATEEGFGRYRNGRFGAVVENLRALCREKKEHHNLPNVIATFNAMRSNRSEIDAFLTLMKKVGVDGARIMSLDPFPHLLARSETRNGFRFTYKDEVLTYQELEEFVETARALAAEKSLPLLSVTDFACEQGPGGLPICSEPWKTINPLKRGLIVCGFNKDTAVVKWSEREGRTIEQFLSEVWNGPVYQEIRSALAAGKLHPICKRSNNCPIAARLRHAEDACN